MASAVKISNTVLLRWMYDDKLFSLLMNGCFSNCFLLKLPAVAEEILRALTYSLTLCDVFVTCIALIPLTMAEVLLVVVITIHINSLRIACFEHLGKCNLQNFKYHYKQFNP